MRAPEFWTHGGVLGAVLSPLGALYAVVGRLRRRWTTAARLPIPVICVGNVTVGGTGKTPTAIAAAQMLAALGAKPWFLTRGYGGREAGPLIVDPSRHDATAVGDEALLLAAAFPTVVARDRPAGGRLAEAGGADVLVMDDGFQNPSLVKDLSILVFDGGVGLGNGRVTPAGPMRETLAEATPRADFALIIGSDATGLRSRLSSSLTVLTGALTPDPGDAAALRGRRLVAFAGIGRPEKFFESLRAIGADLRATRPFADHHRFTPAELAGLRAEAAKQGADLVTTSKDWARLPADQRDGVSVLRVSLVLDDAAALRGALARLRR